MSTARRAVHKQLEIQTSSGMMRLAIGTSVDYSVHIAYAYLIEGVPENKKHKYNTDAKIRHFKA